MNLYLYSYLFKKEKPKDQELLYFFTELIVASILSYIFIQIVINIELELLGGTSGFFNTILFFLMIAFVEEIGKYIFYKITNKHWGYFYTIFFALYEMYVYYLFIMNIFIKINNAVPINLKVISYNILAIRFLIVVFHILWYRIMLKRNLADAILAHFWYDIGIVFLSAILVGNNIYLIYYEYPMLTALVIIFAIRMQYKQIYLNNNSELIIKQLFNAIDKLFNNNKVKTTNINNIDNNINNKNNTKKYINHNKNYKLNNYSRKIYQIKSLKRRDRNGKRKNY